MRAGNDNPGFGGERHIYRHGLLAASLAAGLPPGVAVAETWHGQNQCAVIPALNTKQLIPTALMTDRSAGVRPLV